MHPAAQAHAPFPTPSDRRKGKRQDLTPTFFPRFLAHRGAGKSAPENTLLAFRTGLAAGFTAFECDVQLSRDGVPFLLHDDGWTARATAKAWPARWTGCSCPSWTRAAGTGAAAAGEPLMSLSALAALAQAHALQINLELKPSPGEAARVGAGVVAWLQAHWRAAPPLLSSFEPEALRAAGTAYPRALLLERWHGAAPAQAQQLGACAVVCQHASLDGPAIAVLHGAGLRAWAYTVNDEAEARRLLAARLDALITDRLDLPSRLL